MIRLSKTVVVTGASVGVGLAAVLAFVGRGDRAALLARGSAGLAAAADEARHAGGEALTVTVDAADPKAIDRAAQQMVDAFGRIDGAVARRQHIPSRLDIDPCAGAGPPAAAIYEPELAARAIVHAAAHPRWREYWIGGSTVATVVANALVPGRLGRYLARTGHDSQLEEGEHAGTGYLWSPADGARGRDFGAHGRFDAESRPGSAQEWVSRNRGRAGKAAVIVCGAAVFARKVTRSAGDSHLGPSRGVRPLRAGGRGKPV
ncbi:SDR family NAD(P)-dependent oxidoreductase [Streptomyces sp. NPDC056656]|uniref:SDR family NAD(P)-dependent oxidoreductase n=1 Tax=Streptomyces sp. NPDC056656 TaxID=3345895 RepID=UPI0036C7EBB4